MMKNLYIVGIGVALLLAGCKEQGCTNEKADNFSETAEEDDESCTFSGDIVFWNDSQSSEALRDAGYITPLSLFVGGEKIGTLNFYNYLSKEPSCIDDFSSSTYEETLTYNHVISSESEYLTVKIEDNSGVQLSSKIVTVNANDCQTVKI